eukprot:6190788-Pleurochrysis_carterae.AAC.2
MQSGWRCPEVCPLYVALRVQVKCSDARSKGVFPQNSSAAKNCDSRPRNHMYLPWDFCQAIASIVQGQQELTQTGLVYRPQTGLLSPY